VPGFYERLGWERWLGPTSVRTATGTERTPDDDGGIMILRTPASPGLDLTANIACDWRDGDVW
jgi:aminoglycoside 2'-N-acetyltransferase I